MRQCVVLREVEVLKVDEEVNDTKYDDVTLRVTGAQIKAVEEARNRGRLIYRRTPAPIPFWTRLNCFVGTDIYMSKEDGDFMRMINQTEQLWQEP